MFGYLMETAAEWNKMECNKWREIKLVFNPIPPKLEKKKWNVVWSEMKSISNCFVGFISSYFKQFKQSNLEYEDTLFDILKYKERPFLHNKVQSQHGGGFGSQLHIIRHTQGILA